MDPSRVARSEIPQSGDQDHSQHDPVRRDQGRRRPHPVRRGPQCEHFGGKLGPGSTPEFGGVTLRVNSHDDLFKGLPDEFQVWASHNDEVKTIPAGFEVTASSETCPHEAVRCIDRPIYGVQFHPEVENTEHGPEIFQNFLDIVAEQRR